MIRPQILKDNHLARSSKKHWKTGATTTNKNSAHEEVWCLGDSPELNNNQPQITSNNQLPVPTTNTNEGPTSRTFKDGSPENSHVSKIGPNLPLSIRKLHFQVSTLGVCEKLPN